MTHPSCQTIPQLSFGAFGTLKNQSVERVTRELYPHMNATFFLVISLGWKLGGIDDTNPWHPAGYCSPFVDSIKSVVGVWAFANHFALWLPATINNKLTTGEHNKGGIRCQVAERLTYGPDTAHHHTPRLKLLIASLLTALLRMMHWNRWMHTCMSEWWRGEQLKWGKITTPRSMDVGLNIMLCSPDYILCVLWDTCTPNTCHSTQSMDVLYARGCLVIISVYFIGGSLCVGVCRGCVRVGEGAGAWGGLKCQLFKISHDLWPREKREEPPKISCSCS